MARRARLELNLAAAGLLAVLAADPASAGISDLSGWTLVEDPPNASFSGTASAGSILLSALGGPIPAATDIGFQSVNGATPATSTTGHAFSPLMDFRIAIDFSISTLNPVGQLGIGFGIGEDGDGRNSAGAALLVNNGAPSILFGAAARVNDSNRVPLPILVLGALAGSLFVDFDALSGDITLGASQTPGAAAWGGSATFSGLQKDWSGGDLLASVFLRSDSTLASPWQGGSAEVEFSNFRVLEGTASPVPAPATLALLALGALALRRAGRASTRP
jgi:hypothetical protein